MTLDKLLGQARNCSSITELEQVCVYLSPYKHPHTYQIVDIIEYTSQLHGDIYQFKNISSALNNVMSDTCYSGKLKKMQSKTLRYVERDEISFYCMHS